MQIRYEKNSGGLVPSRLKLVKNVHTVCTVYAQPFGQLSDVYRTGGPHLQYMYTLVHNTVQYIYQWEELIRVLAHSDDSSYGSISVRELADYAVVSQQ
jgi:hypothetical protein